MKVLVLSMVLLFCAWPVWSQEAGGGSTSISVDEITKDKKAEKEAEFINSAEADAFEQSVEMELIEVTGSYIKRVDDAGTSPVAIVDKTYLKQTGQNSIADVFRESAVTNQSVREDSLSGNPGAATAGIGIFGPSRVLTLLDGQRLPKMGGANTVDLNLIPMSAIERVEILKDGASATYGSDAIGGVMNFITKKNFAGGEVSIRQTSTEQGEGSRGNASITFGRTYKKGSFLVALETKDNTHLADSARDYSRINNVITQGSETGDFGTLQDLNAGGVYFSNPDCPAGNQDTFTDTNGNSNTICRYDYTTFSWNLPDIQQTSALLTGEYKFSKHFKSRSTVTAVHRDVQTRLAPPPDTIRLTASEANTLFGADGFTASGTAAPVLLRYRLADEAGPRRTEDETNMFNVSQRFYGQIKGSWTWDMSGSFGKSIRRNTGNGYADKRIVTAKILDGSFKPWNPKGQKGDLSGALITTHEGERSDLGTMKAVTSGALYNGGRYFGPIAVALGGSLNWQHYSKDVDQVTALGANWGGIGSNGQGSRSYQGIFAELSAFPTDSVEVGLAARMDHYTDFGNAFTPKISLSWQPNDKVKFRTSLGTGFRAPNLSDLYSGVALSYPTFADPVGADLGIAGAGSAQQYETRFFSRDDLREETSAFFNFGVLAQPKKNWSIEANFFYAKIKDGVGSPSNFFILKKQKDLMDEGIASGLTQEQALEAATAEIASEFDTIIERSPEGRLITLNRPSAFNVATERLQGIDLGISNKSQASILGLPITVVTKMEHIQFLRTASESFPGTGMLAQRDIDWKNRFILTGIHKWHSMSVVARTQAGLETNLSFFQENNGSLPTYTAYDLAYTHGNVFGGALTVGMKNVFNDSPPLDSTQFSPSSRLDTTLYDQLGRVFYANVDYAF